MGNGDHIVPDRGCNDEGWARRIDLGSFRGDSRFSIAWPRVVPTGDGEINPKGLDYYSRLVDELPGAGIEPFVTLYPWDLPQALQDRGGCEQCSTIDAYLRYLETVVKSLGDRVTN